MTSPAGAPDGVLDTDGMFAVTAGLPEQVQAALDAGGRIANLPSRERVENVVVLGMGGSGIAGDILLAIAAPFMAIPVVVLKSYTLPAFVGEGSLVFAVSYSGNTEETIEAATEAAMQGAKVVAVTSGGELARLAESWNAPLLLIPGSAPHPRAAIGSMSIPPLLVLEEVGLFPGAAEWVELAVAQLRRRRDELVKAGNPAARLAERIGRTMPLVHSSAALGAAAAMRWKAQFNENVKCPANFAIYPELCHNEVQGWGQHGDITRQLTTVINLRHDAEHPQVSRRFELVADLLREVVHAVEEVHAEGEGDLAQLLDLVLFGDFVSLHAAAQEGIDPGPIPVLTALKQRLAAGAAS